MVPQHPLPQFVGFIGALFILVAYIAHQFKKMDAEGTLYNAMNSIGAAILAYVALNPFQLGFVVMETTWTGVSLFALAKAMQRGR